MDGGLAVGTLPTSLGAGTEVRAATSKPNPRYPSHFGSIEGTRNSVRESQCGAVLFSALVGFWTDDTIQTLSTAGSGFSYGLQTIHIQTLVGLQAAWFSLPGIL